MSAAKTPLGGQHRVHGLWPDCHLHRQKRGFITYAEARLRVSLLSFLWHKLPTHRGFFYHFANINTGERIWDSEVSSVDTAILLCGVLTCRKHFHDKDIDELAHAIFDRVDWTWLSEDTACFRTAGRRSWDSFPHGGISTAN